MLVLSNPPIGFIQVKPNGPQWFKDTKKIKIIWLPFVNDLTNKVKWTIIGGTLKINPDVANLQDFNYKAGEYEINFINPGKYTVDMEMTYQNENNMESIEKRKIVIDLLDKNALYLIKGPEWSPVGSIVSGGGFELEKGDLFSLKAIIPSDIKPEQVAWSGDGVEGIGHSKDIKYDTTGVKNISMTIDGVQTKVIVYVNDNASSPITYGEISKSKTWVHCGEESIKFTASAIDYDWVNGVLDTTNNRINIDATKWYAVMEFAEFDKEKGKEVNWTPSSKTKTGHSAVFAHLYNQKDDYYPRNDNYISCQTKVGTFKVYIRCRISSSVNIAEDSSLYEDGTEKLNVKGKFVLKSNDSDIITKNSDGSKKTDWKVGIDWDFSTIPPEAIPEGTIEAYLSIASHAKIKGKAYLEGNFLEGMIDPANKLNIGVDKIPDEVKNFGKESFVFNKITNELESKLKKLKFNKKANEHVKVWFNYHSEEGSENGKIWVWKSYDSLKYIPAKKE